MKYIIASDIHGSAYYCGLLLKRMEAEQAERLILLGDILYHGPRNDLPQGYAPKEVIPMLNSIREKILCVRGNCDAEVDQMVLDFPILEENRVVDLLGRRVFLTHGHHFHVDQLPEPALLDGARYLLYGHTHIPLNTVRGEVRCLNPGSVSIPKAGSWHGYMTAGETDLMWKDLEGHVKDRQIW